MLSINRIKKMNIFLYGLLLMAVSCGESIKLLGINISWIIAGMMVCLTLVYLIVEGNIGDKRIQYRMILFFAFFWMVYMLFQVLWIKDFELWTAGILSNIINVFLILDIWIFLRTEKDLKLFLSLSVPVWLFNVGLGMYEIISNNHFIFEGVSYWDRNYVRTFFGNPNDAATWIVLSYLFLSYYLNKYVRTRMIMIISCAITTFVVFNTGSRACLYGMILYAVFYCCSILMIRAKMMNNAMKLISYVTVTISVIYLIYALYGGGLSALIVKFAGKGSIMSDFTRLKITTDTIRTIVNSALFGVGANQTIAYIGINPHNFLLEMFSDFGVIVFGMVCAFLVNIINVLFRAEWHPRIRAHFCAFTVTFIVISISSSSMNRLRLTWLLLTIMFLTTNKMFREDVSHNIRVDR